MPVILHGDGLHKHYIGTAGGGQVKSGGSVQRRRHWTPVQKLKIVKQVIEPGSSVLLLVMADGLSAAQLFQWRKAYMEVSLVAVGANETVVPASDLNRPGYRGGQLV